MKLPKFHFSQIDNWMNDPNGLIVANGVYHLFFQSNPNDKNWGNIGWGHAISKDLITWEKVTNALYADDKVMIFSGSAVSSNNILGFNEGLISFYTECEYQFDEENDFVVKKQTQNIAYSDISGINWKTHPKNPILDINSTEFRDPKVIKLDEALWLMLVTRSRDYQIDFYLSHDLVNWSFSSKFSDCNFRSGAWECPDLIKVSINKVDKYILTISVDDGFTSGGSGVLYIIGDLIEGTFNKDCLIMGGDDYKILDKGPDFFASQSFYNDNSTEASTIVGWLNNWKYAKEMPNMQLPLLQSIPRQISMVLDTQNNVLLRQIPTTNIHKYVNNYSHLDYLELQSTKPIEFKNIEGCLIYSAEFFVKNEADIIIKVSDSFQEAFTIEIHQSFSKVTITRYKSKVFKTHVNQFSTNFSPLTEVLDINIVMDYFCVEIFINNFTEVFSMHLGRYFEAVDILTTTNQNSISVKSISLNTANNNH